MIKIVNLKTEELVHRAVAGLQERKGHDVVSIDLRRIDNCFCSFFVIATGTSSTHINALLDSVEMFVKKDTGENPIHIEGASNSSWVIVDYGDVVVHIFEEEARQYYDLESYWGDGKLVKEDL